MSRYVVGIDLGTTNCAVAAIDTSADHPRVEHAAVLQVVGPGEVAARATMPSFLLLPAEHEVASEAMALPWTGPARFAVGGFAQTRGAELPHRLVSSAKSWLCNPSIDRNAQVLPFRGAQRELEAEMQGGERVSPVNASARYLAHLRHAPYAVRLVAAADKLHNARSVLADYKLLGESLWAKFTGGREGTLWFYPAVVAALQAARQPGEERLDALIAELARVVAELERESSAAPAAARPSAPPDLKGT